MRAHTHTYNIYIGIWRYICTEISGGGLVSVRYARPNSISFPGRLKIYTYRRIQRDWLIGNCVIGILPPGESPNNVRDRRRRRRIRPASRTLSAPEPQLLMIWPRRKSKNLGVCVYIRVSPPHGSSHRGVCVVRLQCNCRAISPTRACPAGSCPTKSFLLSLSLSLSRSHTHTVPISVIRLVRLDTYHFVDTYHQV